MSSKDLTFKDVQATVHEWSHKNFGCQPAWMPMLGVAEEVGELYHSFLKQQQGIRIDEDHDAKMQDAIGDIIIYLADVCGRMNIDLHECVEGALAEVLKRDWQANPISGATPDNA